MAMEDAIFIGYFPIEIPISSGFPIATFDYRRVYNVECWDISHNLIWVFHTTSCHKSPSMSFGLDEPAAQNHQTFQVNES